MIGEHFAHCDLSPCGHGLHIEELMRRVWLGGHVTTVGSTGNIVALGLSDKHGRLVSASRSG